MVQPAKMESKEKMEHLVPEAKTEDQVSEDYLDHKARQEMEVLLETKEEMEHQEKMEHKEGLDLPVLQEKGETMANPVSQVQQDPQGPGEKGDCQEIEEPPEKLAFQETQGNRETMDPLELLDHPVLLDQREHPEPKDRVD